MVGMIGRLEAWDPDYEFRLPPRIRPMRIQRINGRRRPLLETSAQARNQLPACQ